MPCDWTFLADKRQRGQRPPWKDCAANEAGKPLHKPATSAAYRRLRIIDVSCLDLLFPAISYVLNMHGPPVIVFTRIR
jgi:hypothetical protein